ncbi:MAG: TonB-dependent receptor [Candidatus Acidiferrales bacterium]
MDELKKRRSPGRAQIARRMAIVCLLTLSLADFSPAETTAGKGPISGQVVDTQGGAIVGAETVLWASHQVPLGTTTTDQEGKFEFRDIPQGHYLLVVKAKGFGERRLPIQAPTPAGGSLQVQLELAAMAEEVTVTAYSGSVEFAATVAQSVNVIDGDDIRNRVQAVTAQVAQEEPGVQLQRTSPTIAGIYVRGVTGAKVNLYLDGVRYTTSAARGGISTFLNLIEPSALDTVEVLRGPAGAQYGSDAIGGSVQFMTPTPAFSPSGIDIKGDYGTLFNSADASYGTHLNLSAAGRRVALQTTIAGRRINRLRTGHGIDSHSALTRFLGLPSTVLEDERRGGTAFTQYGGMSKLSWTPAVGSNFVFSYSRSQQDGGQRYDQLLGGDGNLIADLRNLMLDLFYVRYDKVSLGWLDTLTAIYSFNAQREERVNQGGNGNPNASINHEYEKARAHGVQLYSSKQMGSRNMALAGAEYYHEGIDAPSFGFDPITAAISLRRPRVPDNALYRSGGVYVQDSFQLIPQRLHLIGNLRWSYASYRARAADSPLVGGQPLWVDDSLRVSSWTYRAGVIVFPIAGLSFSANFSRGFRAPNMSDLGTLGLTGTGFEVSASELAGLGAEIGDTAGSDAVSSGLPVIQLEPETAQSYEFTIRYRNSRFSAEVTGFINDLGNELTKQALILPPGAVGLTLGGEPITSQLPSGVVFVDAATSPVLVRANFDQARSFGLEHELDFHITRSLLLRTVSSFARINNTDTGEPSNISGGSPAADAYLILRYAPLGKRWWIEPYIHAAERQDHLSSLALGDRRTGATRTRSSIANFFNRGARVRGLVSAGLDGIPGNADDILIPTGETLGQVQDRVLGPGVNSAPLFPAMAGYITLNLRGGFSVRERHEFVLSFENIGDRNYRGVNWGIDAPGRSLSLRYFTRF